jgi:hypothetical protein
MYYDGDSDSYPGHSILQALTRKQRHAAILVSGPAILVYAPEGIGIFRRPRMRKQRGVSPEHPKTNGSRLLPFAHCPAAVTHGFGESLSNGSAICYIVTDIPHRYRVGKPWRLSTGYPECNHATGKSPSLG